jgi:hypothetical protein
MQPLSQPAQLLQRPHQLVLGADNLVASLLAGGRPLAAAKGHRQRSEPSLGPVV